VEPDYDSGCYIRACWASREETPEALADRFVKLIDRIRQIDAVFELWTSDSGGPKPFETLRNHYAEVVKSHISDDDFGDPVPVDGYWFGGYTRGQPDSRRYVINVHAGAHKPTTKNQNDLMFQTTTIATPAPSSVTYPLFKAVLLAIVDIWKPDDCLVMPEQLMDLMDLDRHFRDPWMQYLSKPFADLITPPGNVIVERFADGGLLLSATTETFDVANPAHLAGARAIGSATAPLEKLPYVRDPKFR
jgi:hypothetical protein